MGWLRLIAIYKSLTSAPLFGTMTSKFATNGPGYSGGNPSPTVAKNVAKSIWLQWLCDGAAFWFPWAVAHGPGHGTGPWAGAHGPGQWAGPMGGSMGWAMGPAHGPGPMGRGPGQGFWAHGSGQWAWPMGRANGPGPCAWAGPMGRAHQNSFDSDPHQSHSQLWWGSG